MPKYDVPVIVQVNAKDIEEARKITYKMIDELANDLFTPFDPGTVNISIADDEQRINDGRRIVLLHPADTDSEYDPKAYREALATRDDNDDA